MMRKVLTAALLILLPVAAGAQIQYYPTGGGSVTTIQTNSTAVTTAGTSSEVLHTLTLPGGSLQKIGDIAEVNMTAVHAANGNTKNTQIKLTSCAGASLIALSSASSGISLFQGVRCTRTGDSTMLCVGSTTNTAVTAFTTAGAALTGLSFSGDIVFVACVTTATQAGDVTVTSSKLTVTK
jgi:hypothetical protein